MYVYTQTYTPKILLENHAATQILFRAMSLRSFSKFFLQG